MFTATVDVRLLNIGLPRPRPFSGLRQGTPWRGDLRVEGTHRQRELEFFEKVIQITRV